MDDEYLNTNNINWKFSKCLALCLPVLVALVFTVAQWLFYPTSTLCKEVRARLSNLTMVTMPLSGRSGIWAQKVWVYSPLSLV